MLHYGDALHLPLDAVDVAGRNVLFYALHGTDNSELLDYLLHFDVPICAANDGRTLLMSACLSNNLSAVRYLVDNASKLGIDVAELDSKGRNCLFYAITSADVELFAIVRTV